jgi:zinc transporter ZupT
MNTTLLFITVIAFLFTYLGSYLATKIQNRKHILLSFSAGAILAVALFDLIPHGFEALGDFKITSLFVIGGFALYFLLNNFFAMTAHRQGDSCQNHYHGYGIWGLGLHSLMDGLAIGFSFQASPTLGIAVAIGILAHRLADGINSVALTIKNKTNQMGWIHFIALAPVIGILIGSFVIVPENVLGYILAFSAGLFLYISASDLVPECHTDNPKLATSASFLAGILFLLGILSFGHTHAHPDSHKHEHSAACDHEHGHEHDHGH